MSTASAGTLHLLRVDKEPGVAEMEWGFVNRNNGSISGKTAASVSEGFERPVREEFDCIVSDHDMPGENDIELLTDIQDCSAELSLIRFIGTGLAEFATESHPAGDRFERRRTQDEAVASFGHDTLIGVEIETLFSNLAELVSARPTCEYVERHKNRP